MSRDKDFYITITQIAYEGKMLTKILTANTNNVQLVIQTCLLLVFTFSSIQNNLMVYKIVILHYQTNRYIFE